MARIITDKDNKRRTADKSLPKEKEGKHTLITHEVLTGLTQ
jgi:hypothetical protein